MHLKNPY